MLFKKISIVPVLGYFLAAILLVVAPACRFFGHNTSNVSYLVVGTNPFMPYMFIDENNEYNGFDMELARKIADHLGLSLQIKNLSFEALIIELMQGKIDCIMGGLSITPIRAEKFTLIHYTGAGKKSLPLVFWKAIPEGVHTVDDLRNLENRVICVQPASLQEDLFSRFPFLELKCLDSVTDMLMEIRYGKSIACALEHEVAASLSHRYQELKIMTVPLPKDLQDGGVGIGIRKNNTVLAQKIAETIALFKKDGTLAHLEQKWFKEAVHAN